MRRPDYLALITQAFRVTPMVALLGPRQCGKTTLAKEFVQSSKRHQKTGGVTFFDLENPRHVASLENPLLALENLKGLIVIDEVQKSPGLFEVLRVLVDRSPRVAQFLILGSASRDLIKQSSETLAGRISYLEIAPFNGIEVGTSFLERLWLRGGFPRSFLATSERISAQWRREYIATYLERDIPALGIQIPAAALRRFWMMIAHYHGQILNASDIGRSMGIGHTTVQRYIDVLTGTFMIRRLSPWIENLGKRLVKAPKIYFRDSGLYHALIDQTEKKQLATHPKLGASWEGFALEQLINFHHATTDEAYFWATHNQAELDLLILKNGRRIGYEIKYTDRPHTTKSMRIALQDLRLDELIVIHPGEGRFRLEPQISSVGLKTILSQAVLQK